MAFTYSGISQYFILSKTTYNNLESKSDQALYFISDTKEIFRGTVNYTDAIVVVNGLPSSNPLTSKVYLNTNDNTLNIYNNGTWITYGSINNSVSSTVETDGTATALAVSGIGIKSFVEQNLEISSASDINATTLYNNLQLPVTISRTQGSSTYTCTFTKKLSQTSAMGCYVTYTVKQGSTTKSTNDWYPGNYNEYANSMEILTELGTAAIAKLI